MSGATRCTLAALIAALLGVLGTSAARTSAADKPNILFILTDDQRWDTIGALGNPEIKTPNTDRLVDEGFTFSNAYCMGSMVGAVCLPSRTMLATGRSLWRILPNPAAKTAPPGVPLLPVLLNEAGYATFHCGKGGNACTASNAAFQTNVTMKPRSADSATECADHAIAFLKNHDGAKPFFMYLAPPVPHDPRLAPAEFVRLYDPAKITLSKNFMPRHPFDNGELRIRDEMLAAFPRTPEEMRRHLADYYATISHMDHEVGRILDAVKDRGWRENTVVIFSSDQGLAVGGRHGLMGKQNLYEHVKPPLVFVGPGIPHGRGEALVYLYDLFPTICELAGAPVPPVVEGKSLLPVIQGRQDKVREHLLGAYKDCQRMIRDDRWKLLAYNVGGVKTAQLFDLANDPDELNNLADDPKCAAERERLEKLLAQARKEFGDPINDEPAGMSWLDNGRIRLGVDLSIGGAITHLSDAGTKVNMINSHDWGRQIQMSFYSGPTPFVPPGAKVSPAWKGLGWNPIQSGDCFGHRSRVTEHRNDGQTLYVRSVPMQWPLENVPGECAFECWFRLDGPTVQATSRLTNHRSDRTPYPARSQELPAVYTNGPWYKLVSYLGDRPFTGAAPTVVVDRDDGKGWPWRTFYSPEHWAALVDKDDRGLGLYLPGACAFTGGFSGQKGAGGPKDGPTGYMTPRHVDVLDHNIVYTYQYALIVGTLEEIRKYVGDHHDKETLPQWRFAEDRQHWHYRNTTDAGWPIRDCLVARMGPDEAVLVGPKTFWRAEDAPKLYLRAAFETGATSAVVAFQPFDDVDAHDWPAWGETKRPAPAPAGRVPLAIQGDGKTRTLEIDLSAHKDYRGAMTQLSLLLPAAKGTAKVYSIGFHPPATQGSAEE